MELNFNTTCPVRPSALRTFAPGFPAMSVQALAPHELFIHGRWLLQSCSPPSPLASSDITVSYKILIGFDKRSRNNPAALHKICNPNVGTSHFCDLEFNMAWSKVLFPLSIAILSLFPPVSLASEENIRSERPQDLVEWKDCELAAISVDFQCGYFEIPLDWHDPSGGTGRLAFTKYKASGPSKGTIFVDPGMNFVTAPGLSPQMWFFNIGLHNLTGGEYDIIFWDVRGRGLHTIPGALTCFDSPESLSTFWWPVARKWAPPFHGTITLIRTGHPIMNK
ncbi:hypothetical protein A0H81_10216 [Grifola frondosa]|uniref:AB hydrolase-1 domain-containing protein n=1 Tax=Grifola frondosa TaxID=5627 RepID=A0A1C7LYZ2_GRIFR|nr:hypothetical protein A0H81_10216 [Grifola frondosa]